MTEAINPRSMDYTALRDLHPSKHAVHFSSGSDEWETPPDLFACLNREFAFTLDAAAASATAKCARFFTKEDDALTQDWLAAATHIHTAAWLNPPYSRGLQARFLTKAADEAARGLIVCCLIPARPDTAIWHSTIFPRAQVRFLKGRVRFVGAAASAPFPSAIVVFGLNEPPRAFGWDWKQVTP